MHSPKPDLSRLVTFHGATMIGNDGCAVQTQTQNWTPNAQPASGGRSVAKRVQGETARVLLLFWGDSK